MSLRNRLLVGMAVVAVVLVAASAAIARLTERDLVDGVDAQLESTRTFRQGGPGGPDFSGPRSFSSFFVGAVVDGRIVPLVEPNATDEDLALPAIPVDRLTGGGGPFTVGSDGDLRYRVLARRDGRTGRTLAVALPLDGVDAAVRRLVRVEALVTVVVLAVLGLVTWWVERLGVRPLRAMTATATAIAGGDLSQRVPATVPGTEAGQLGRALNTMLGRIEAAFDERSRSEARLRQFVADASHELRTPVTTIRGYAELYRVGALEEEGALGSAMRRTEQEAVRMGSLIEDLLLLARLDQGRPLERAPVDLAALAEDAVRDAGAVEPGRRVHAAVAGAVGVVGDEGRLRQVLANLVGNALVHAPAPAAVEVRARTEDGRAVLEVADDGPGMPPEVAEHAFERFFRADAARTRATGGSGLGLSIVRAIVDAHGGTVALRSAPGAGTTVRVELPATTSLPP